MLFLVEKYLCLTQISLKFIPKCRIDDKSALVQAMTWNQTDVKPLPEAMVTKFSDVYMHHQVWMS